MIAGRLATRTREESLIQNASSDPPIGASGHSIAEAAELLNVSERSVQRARTVQLNHLGYPLGIPARKTVIRS